MSGAKTAIAQTLEFVALCSVAVRVSSMWGFGGNWRGGLLLMPQVFMRVLRFNKTI